ncbi:hypothetical protein M0Q50_01015 [bacterium]|jgi:hypothetical protein|nr:hypothetical protein [bacterium]
MKIQANTLLSTADKTIEFYNSSIVVKDGPNMGGSIKLGDLQIPYDSFFTSKMTLPSKGKYFPILYGFLGTDVTFLMVKVNYGGDISNPQTCENKDKIIEYYLENSPSEIRNISQLLILTGNENHRIPQVYLYNPSDYDVTVEILVSNIGENTITNNLVGTFSTITGLAYNDIITDQIFSINYTGSTQYEILDIENNIQMIIPYNNIDITKIEGDTITIITKSTDPIKLTFISETQAKQAFSRINWVRELTSQRYLTKINLGMDITAPVITFKSSEPTGITYATPILKSDIVYYFIQSIVDNRDGIINNNNINLMIYKVSSGELFDSITQIGDYILTFYISDIAGNQTAYIEKTFSVTN